MYSRAHAWRAREGDLACKVGGGTETVINRTKK
jgi:hypothetical protein